MPVSLSQIRQFAALLTRRRLNARWRQLAVEHRERWAGPGAGRGQAEMGRPSTKHLPPMFQPQVPGPNGPPERDRVSAYPPFLEILNDSRLRPFLGFCFLFQLQAGTWGTRTSVLE